MFSLFLLPHTVTCALRRFLVAIATRFRCIFMESGAIQSAVACRMRGRFLPPVLAQESLADPLVFVRLQGSDPQALETDICGYGSLHPL